MTTLAMKRTAVEWTVGIAVVGVVALAAAAIHRPGTYGNRPGVMAPSQMFEGAIVEIRGSSAAPLAVSLAKADGSTIQVAVDPQETVVLRGGRVAEFNTLEKGQQVKTRYALKDGKEVARSIEITDPLPMLAPASTPAAASTEPEKPMSEF